MGVGELGYDLVSGVEGESPTCPFVLMVGYFVATADVVAIPAAAGVGEVEGGGEVGVEVGLVGYAEGVVVVALPEVAAVVGAAWGAVHADGGDGCQRSKLLQVFTEVLVGCDDVALACGEGFVMVAYFVPQGMDLLYNFGVVAFGDGSEVVGGFELELMFYLCGA